MALANLRAGFKEINERCHKVTGTIFNYLDLEARKANNIDKIEKFANYLESDWNNFNLNKLDEKYTIYVDQKLVLEDENAPATKTQAIESTKITAKPLPSSKPTTTVSSVDVKKPAETVVKSTPSVGTNVQDTVKNGSLTWTWPMTGSLLKRFSTEGVGSKGIDIAGKRGDIVKAAADGVVVYAGEGLVGYGKLLIVRHNDEYITAYAHNDRLIATEGQKIKLGQTIAEVGSTGTDKDKLHFEIRYKGKPIDPLTILPK